MKQTVQRKVILAIFQNIFDYDVVVWSLCFSLSLRHLSLMICPFLIFHSLCDTLLMIRVLHSTSLLLLEHLPLVTTGMPRIEISHLLFLMSFFFVTI